MRGFSKVLALSLPVILLLLCAAVRPGMGSSCRGGCMNGGKLLLPNNIFGLCRCKCPPPFMGPNCQFVIRKRSDPDLSQTIYLFYKILPKLKNIYQNRRGEN